MKTKKQLLWMNTPDYSRIIFKLAYSKITWEEVESEYIINGHNRGFIHTHILQLRNDFLNHNK